MDPPCTAGRAAPLRLRLSPGAVVATALLPTPDPATDGAQHFARVLAPLFGLVQRSDDLDPRPPLQHIRAFLGLTRPAIWLRVRLRRYLAARLVLARFVARTARGRRERLQYGLRQWAESEGAGAKADSGAAGGRRAKAAMPSREKLLVLRRMHREECHKLLRRWRTALQQHRLAVREFRSAHLELAACWLRGGMDDIEVLGLLRQYHALADRAQSPPAGAVLPLNASWRVLCHNSNWGDMARPRAAPKEKPQRPRPKPVEVMLEEGEAVLQRLQTMARLTPPRDQDRSPSARSPTSRGVFGPSSPSAAAAAVAGGGRPTRLTPPGSPRGRRAASAHVKRIAGLRSAKASESPGSTPPASPSTASLAPEIGQQTPSSSSQTSAASSPSPSPTRRFFASSGGSRRPRLDSPKRHPSSPTSNATGFPHSFALTGQPTKNGPPLSATPSLALPGQPTDLCDPPDHVLTGSFGSAALVRPPCASGCTAEPVSRPASLETAPLASPRAPLASPRLASLPPPAPPAPPPVVPAASSSLASPGDAPPVPDRLPREVSARTFFLAVNDAFTPLPSDRTGDRPPASPRFLRLPFSFPKTAQAGGLSSRNFDTFPHSGTVPRPTSPFVRHGVAR